MTPSLINKADSPDLFDTISVGDRVETWDGIWGWVQAITPRAVADWRGEPVLIGAVLTIHSEHLPTFDAHGWPASQTGTITRLCGKYSHDLRYAYTPRGARSSVSREPAAS